MNKPLVEEEAGVQFLLVGIQTTVGGNTPLMGRVDYFWVGTSNHKRRATQLLARL